MQRHAGVAAGAPRVNPSQRGDQAGRPTRALGPVRRGADARDTDGPLERRHHVVPGVGGEFTQVMVPAKPGEAVGGPFRQVAEVVADVRRVGGVGWTVAASPAERLALEEALSECRDPRRGSRADHVAEPHDRKLIAGALGQVAQPRFGLTLQVDVEIVAPAGHGRARNGTPNTARVLAWITCGQRVAVASPSTSSTRRRFSARACCGATVFTYARFMTTRASVPASRTARSLATMRVRAAWSPSKTWARSGRRVTAITSYPEASSSCRTKPPT